MNEAPAGPGRPPGPADLAERAERAAALCERAAAAVAASPPPADEVLWLAEQLADVGRLLGQALRAGTIAADAYERGRLDERAASAAAGCHLVPA